MALDLQLGLSLPLLVVMGFPSCTYDSTMPWYKLYWLRTLVFFVFDCLQISDDEDDLPIGADFLSMNASSSKMDEKNELLLQDITTAVQNKTKEFSKFFCTVTYDYVSVV